MGNDTIITEESVNLKRKITCSEIDRQIIAKVSRKMLSLRPIIPARRQSAVDSEIDGQHKDVSSESAKMGKAHGMGENSTADSGGQNKVTSTTDFEQMGKAQGMEENLAVVPDSQHKDTSLESVKKEKELSVKERLAAYPDNYDGKCAKLILLCKVAHALEEREEAAAAERKLLKEKQKAEEEEKKGAAP